MYIRRAGRRRGRARNNLHFNSTLAAKIRTFLLKKLKKIRKEKPCCYDGFLASYLFYTILSAKCAGIHLFAFAHLAM